MYGLLGYGLIALGALGVAFGSGWHYGSKGPRAALAKLTAQVEVDNAQRAKLLRDREAEDDLLRQRLRESAAQSDAAIRDAAARTAAARDAVAALAAEMRAARLGGTLPGSARRVFDAAAGAGSGAAAQARSSADGPPADAGNAAGAGRGYAGGLASRTPDSAPVECVTVFEVGARNTARALFNAAALMACQRDQIALWEAATGLQYPTSELAPWLIKQP